MNHWLIHNENNIPQIIPKFSTIQFISFFFCFINIYKIYYGNNKLHIKKLRTYVTITFQQKTHITKPTNWYHRFSTNKKKRYNTKIQKKKVLCIARRLEIVIPDNALHHFFPRNLFAYQWKGTRVPPRLLTLAKNGVNSSKTSRRNFRIRFFSDVDCRICVCDVLSCLFSGEISFARMWFSQSVK